MDDYFLSRQNPAATTDQRDLEAKALHLLEQPELKKARAIAELLWRQVMAYPAREQMARFDNMISEYVFHYALRAANSDAARPGVLRIMSPPGHWFGRDVPGSRWGGDSPDFIYRIIPIAHGARYEIRARPSCAEPPSATYTLMGNTAIPSTLGTVDSLDLAPDADGAFVVTIDDTPANGRVHHLQTKPGDMHLLVRDALGDWLTQTPNVLRVRRLSGPDEAPPADEELAKRAARSLLEGLYYTYYCTQSGSGQAPNGLRAPVSSAPFGGMATQWGTKGNIELEDDEALIITSNGAGALFRNVTLCDQFFMSADYWSRTSSFNHAQMAADEDERYTYVVAHHDPGVHNWLDTGGLRKLILGHRWQAFARGGATETPSISTRTVKLDALDRELSHGVRRISAGERRAQIERRIAGFGLRFIDR